MQLRELRKRHKASKTYESVHNVEKLAPSKTYELASHTVTVTDVTDVDFVGTGGLLLGTNKVSGDHLFYSST